MATTYASALTYSATTTYQGQATYAQTATFNSTANFTAGVTFSQGYNNNRSTTTVNGSTSGSLIWVQPEQGSAYKNVIIYCSALVGTATFSFSTVFLHTPMVSIDSNTLTTPVPASVVTSLSTSSVTITGATTTGFIMLQGF